jgi:hypothetical protein
MVSGRAWRGGDFFGLFIGQGSGGEVADDWIDIFGCYGSFHLERE